jgi:Uma2 family endonuclease
MATAIKRITAEEFLQLGLKHAELIDGEIEEHIPPSGLHGEVAVNIASTLKIWASANRHGRVGAKSGFIIARDPDQVRAPDLWFIQQERIEGGRSPKDFWTIAPDLAVEVLSDSDTMGVIRGKVNDYFAIGTPLIWLVDPEAQTVDVRTPGNKPLVLQGEDRLENFPSLPGFSCAVADLFA